MIDSLTIYLNVVALNNSFAKYSYLVELEFSWNETAELMAMAYRRQWTDSSPKPSPNSPETDALLNSPNATPYAVYHNTIS